MSGCLHFGALAASTSLLLAGGLVDVAWARSVASRKSATKPVAVVLVLDRAGSMSGYKMARTKHALQGAIRRLRPGDRVAVVSFDVNAYVGLRMSRVRRRMKALAAVRNIPVAPYRVTLTPRRRFRQSLISGSKAAHAQLRRLPKRNKYVRHVLFFVDGKPRASRKQLLKAVRQIRKAGARFSVVALGYGTNPALLRAMAKAGGGTYLLWTGKRGGLSLIIDRLMKRMGR